MAEVDDVDSAADAGIAELAQQVLDRTREEITRADQKASILLAASGIAVGALLGGLLAGRWNPFSLSNVIEWMWWIGVASAGCGISLIASSVYPRVKRKGAQWSGIAYFGDVVAVGRKNLENELRRTVTEGKSSVVDQLFQNSRIVDLKYWGIRNGLSALGAGGVLCVLAVLINSSLA